MANHKYHGPDKKNKRADDLTQNPSKPGKQVDRPDEVVSNKDENIVNTEEQNVVVNEAVKSNTENDDRGNKQKGYEEGLRNDSLNEPEFRDSDDQPVFPGEEGK